MKISVQREDFDLSRETKVFSVDKSIGAIASFVGVVREVAMTLEHYPGMTENALEKIVEEYISRLLIPSDPSGGALHLALASFYECDFLVTWNCKHLANASKFDTIARINGILGIFQRLLRH